MRPRREAKVTGVPLLMDVTSRATGIGLGLPTMGDNRRKMTSFLSRPSYRLCLFWDRWFFQLRTSVRHLSCLGS